MNMCLRARVWMYVFMCVVGYVLVCKHVLAGLLGCWCVCQFLFSYVHVCFFVSYSNVFLCVSA